MRSRWMGAFAISAVSLLGASASAETVVFDFNSQAAAADFVFSYTPVFSRNVSGLGVGGAAATIANGRIEVEGVNADGDEFYAVPFLAIKGNNTFSVQVAAQPLPPGDAGPSEAILRVAKGIFSLKTDFVELVVATTPTGQTVTVRDKNGAFPANVTAVQTQTVTFPGATSGTLQLTVTGGTVRLQYTELGSAGVAAFDLTDASYATKAYSAAFGARALGVVGGLPETIHFDNLSKSGPGVRLPLRISGAGVGADFTAPLPLDKALVGAVATNVGATAKPSKGKLLFKATADGGTSNVEWLKGLTQAFNVDVDVIRPKAFGTGAATFTLQETSGGTPMDVKVRIEPSNHPAAQPLTTGLQWSVIETQGTPLTGDFAEATQVHVETDVSGAGLVIRLTPNSGLPVTVTIPTFNLVRPVDVKFGFAGAVKGDQISMDNFGATGADVLWSQDFVQTIAGARVLTALAASNVAFGAGDPIALMSEARSILRPLIFLLESAPDTVTGDPRCQLPAYSARCESARKKLQEANFYLRESEDLLADPVKNAKTLAKYAKQFEKSLCGAAVALGGLCQ